jgi:trigger factor
MSNANDAPQYPGLDVQVERTEPAVATVRFTVKKEQVAKMRTQGLQRAAKSVRYKGFRAGKAPIAMLEKDFGPKIDAEVIELFINQSFETAVRTEELKPAAAPRIDEEKLEFDRHADFHHEFEVWLRPDIELGQYKGLEVEGFSTEVDDEEFEGALKELRRRESRAEPTGEEGLPHDGVATCKIEFLVPEEEEPILQHEGIQLSPASPLNGVDPAEYEKVLTGAKVDDVLELECAFPEEFPVEAARGRKGTVRLTLTATMKIIPPTDEEFIKAVGAENEEGMREILRTRLGEAKVNQERQRVEMALLDQILERVPMELPEKMLAMQVDAKVAELEESLKDLDLDDAQKAERLEMERQQASEQTARAMRAVYLMEEIAKVEEIQVTQPDLLDEIQAIAIRNGTEPEEVRKYYQEQGLFQQLGLELLERKVRSFLRESADIKISG